MSPDAAVAPGPVAVPEDPAERQLDVELREDGGLVIAGTEVPHQGYSIDVPLDDVPLLRVRIPVATFEPAGGGPARVIYVIAWDEDGGRRSPRTVEVEAPTVPAGLRMLAAKLEE